MAKFMFLFVKLDEPDLETQQALESEWLESLPAGMLDSCAPFGRELRLVTKGTDRDFVDVVFGGYMIVNAESFDDAVEIAQRSAHSALGGKTLVRALA